METFVLFLVTFVLIFLLNWSCCTLANVNLCQKGKYKNPLVLAINESVLHLPLSCVVAWSPRARCLIAPSGPPGLCCGWTAAGGGNWRDTERLTHVGGSLTCECGRGPLDKTQSRCPVLLPAGHPPALSLLWREGQCLWWLTLADAACRWVNGQLTRATWLPNGGAQKLTCVG